MYNQSYNNSAVYGGGYTMDYQQQQYYYQQQQQHHHPASQQHLQQKQQLVAGVMGYYSPEAAAMFYNPYVYGNQQQMAQYQGAQINQRHPQQQHYQGQVDYQLTPALYLLNQQAEILQKSLYGGQPAQPKKSVTSGDTSKGPRKTRGPYKRRTNKSLSPTASPAPEHETDSDRLSSSDISSGSNNGSPNSNQSFDQQQPSQRKRKSDSFLELEEQPAIKQSKPSVETTTGAPRQRTQSIFCSVSLMAESSCAGRQ